MNIIVIGTRGIPNILGGVETHCEELYPLLVSNFKNDITVIGRSCYVVDKSIKDFKGVTLKTLYAPKNKALEAIVHSFIAALYAGVKRPDVVHIHAVGPSLVTPILRLLGLKVVMTHHGPDYERKKWGKSAKMVLKLGEWAGVKFANKVIVISEEIKKSIVTKYGRKDVHLVPNGVSIVGRPIFKEEILSKFNVKRYGYLFSLGRFVPEKGFDYLIRAFQKSSISKNFQLVIAGDADHETEYSLALKEQAKAAGVILTGFIKGDALAQLFSNTALFVLPSFYEGLPIALLESMAYKLPILASDIPANTQVSLAEDSFFPVGDEDVLARKMNERLFNMNVGEVRNYDMSLYDWKNIACNTNDVYNTL